MAKNQMKVKMSGDEASVLVRVLDMIEGKFKFDRGSDRFVCTQQDSVMSLEFEGYAHLNQLRARMREQMAKGGVR